MPLKFCSLASGSSGNCYLIKNQRSALLVDAGISGKKILEGLTATDTPESHVKSLLITHEHIDHVKSVSVLAKKLPGISIYANEATWEGIKKPVPPQQQRFFQTGEDFYIDDFMIRPFSIPHDAADPVGFSIYCEDRQISIVTDVGCITEAIFDEIVGADLLLLEANHEKEILLMSRYPYHLKHRILGDKGHLSNVSAGVPVQADQDHRQTASDTAGASEPREQRSGGSDADCQKHSDGKKYNPRRPAEAGYRHERLHELHIRGVM